MYLTLSIGVGGSKSGVGKTTFIEKLIQHIKKKFEERVNIITLKYTKTSLYSSIISEPSIINRSGKDTERLKKAGADFVYWVRATENDLFEVVERLNKEITSLSLAQNNNQRTILIIEGNSLVRAMQPDVIIFLKDKVEEQIKPSGKAILEIADLVIEGEYYMEEVMTEIEKIEKKKLIGKLLKERSNDGKITCAEARKIAEELKVAYIEVGRAANELKIKIRKCELGCF